MDFTHFRGSRKDPRENLEKQWDHLERPPPLPIMTSPEPPIMPSTETDERPKVKDDCVRTESCVNCNRRMTYNAAFEKGTCLCVALARHPTRLLSPPLPLPLPLLASLSAMPLVWISQQVH